MKKKDQTAFTEKIKETLKAFQDMKAAMDNKQGREKDERNYGLAFDIEQKMSKLLVGGQKEEQASVEIAKNHKSGHTSMQ